jgi:hypothetical protein
VVTNLKFSYLASWQARPLPDLPVTFRHDVNYSGILVQVHGLLGYSYSEPFPFLFHYFTLSFFIIHPKFPIKTSVELSKYIAHLHPNKPLSTLYILILVLRNISETYKIPSLVTKTIFDLLSTEFDTYIPSDIAVRHVSVTPNNSSSPCYNFGSNLTLR